MKAHILFLVLSFVFYTSLFSQTFETVIHSKDDIFALDAIELEDGFIVVSQKGDYDLNDYPEILLHRMSFSGEVIDLIDFNINTSYKLENIRRIYPYDTGYILLGRCMERTTGVYKLYIAWLDSDLGLIREFFSGNNSSSDFMIDCILNSSMNIISIGYTDGFYDLGVFVKEITVEGELVQRRDMDWAFTTSTILELPDKDVYQLTTVYPDFNVTLSRETLQIVDSTELPIFFRPAVCIHHDANDSYLIVCRKYQWPTELNFKLAFIEMNPDGEIIAEHEPYGQPDTNYQIGFSSADFIDSQTFYMAGMHNFTEQPPFLFPEPRWIFMNKLKTDGTIIWQRFYKGELNYCPYRVLTTSDGGALILSHKYDWNKPDNKRDVHILKIDSTGWYEGLPPVGIGEFDQQKQILAYPNPTRDWVHFEPGLYTNLQLTLYDQNGRELLSRPISSDTHINLSEFRAGVYIYVIQNQKGFLEKGKLIKE